MGDGHDMKSKIGGVGEWWMDGWLGGWVGGWVGSLLLEQGGGGVDVHGLTLHERLVSLLWVLLGCM